MVYIHTKDGIFLKFSLWEFGGVSGGKECESVGVPFRL